MSQEDAASLFGVSYSVYQKYEADSSTPGGEAIKGIVKAGINANWLLTGEGKPELQSDIPEQHRSILDAFDDDTDRSGVRLGHSEQARQARLAEKQQQAAPDDYYYLPLYDVHASAGHGAFNHTEEEVARLAFKKTWIHKELGASPKDLCLIYIVGESMEPTLGAGDIILIDQSVKDVKTDGIYVLMLDGTLLTKRCQRLPGKKIRVSSDNQAYQPFVIDENINAPNEYIVGRAIWTGRKI